MQRRGDGGGGAGGRGQQGHARGRGVAGLRAVRRGEPQYWPLIGPGSEYWPLIGPGSEY